MVTLAFEKQSGAGSQIVIAEKHVRVRNQQKLLMQVARGDEGECWEWRGQISNAGYGRLMLKTGDTNKMHSAHRASYELFIGPIDKDGIIVQSCKNRLCVNPEHLQQVTEVE